MMHIEPMTDENRERIYALIRRWDNKHRRTAEDLVNELRGAGFPIVTWNVAIADRLNIDGLDLCPVCESSMECMNLRCPTRTGEGQEGSTADEDG